jgi:hypothetical protein
LRLRDVTTVHSVIFASYYEFNIACGTSFCYL